MSAVRPSAGPIETAFVERYLEGEDFLGLKNELLQQQEMLYGINGFHQFGGAKSDIDLKYLAKDNKGSNAFISQVVDLDRASLALNTIGGTDGPYYRSGKYLALSDPKGRGQIGYPFGKSERVIQQIERARIEVSQDSREGMGRDGRVRVNFSPRP